MKDLPFSTVGINAEEVSTLEQTYQLLKAKFNTRLSSNVNMHVNKFELFSNNPDAVIGGSLIINAPENTCYLTFIKNHFSVSAGGRGGGSQNLDYDKYQVWAFVTLSKNFGRVLIRRKTLTDSILELVNHVELKIEGDQQFNSKYYVIANDREKAIGGLTPELRSVIMSIKNKELIIEIVNDTLVIGNAAPINPELIVDLAEIANEIANVA